MTNVVPNNVEQIKCGVQCPQKSIMVFSDQLLCTQIGIGYVGRIPLVENPDKYGQLKRMPMHFMYFIKVLECVIFCKIYDRHATLRREVLKTSFVLFFLEVHNRIFCDKFLQPRL